LPTPGSPASNTRRPCPLVGASSAISRRRSSGSRPTSGPVGRAPRKPPWACVTIGGRVVSASPRSGSAAEVSGSLASVAASWTRCCRAAASKVARSCGARLRASTRSATVSGRGARRTPRSRSVMARAERRPLGELLLSQTSCQAVALEQGSKSGRGTIRAHAAYSSFRGYRPANGTAAVVALVRIIAHPPAALSIISQTFGDTI
jgi:hypothetical protein